MRLTLANLSLFFGSGAFLLSGCSTIGVRQTVVNKVEQQYFESQTAWEKRDYNSALPLLLKYIKNAKHPQKEDRLMQVIDQIGEIYLRINQDPDRAILFLSQIKNHPHLSEAEEDDIEEWLTVAESWKQFLVSSNHPHTSQQLYYLGKRYYLRGLSKSKYLADDTGNADFYIATSYLMPFVIYHNQNKKIGEVLFMMGDIHRRARSGKGFLAENFYLKEVIRRFPHTSLALKAWHALNNAVHLGYSGSGGDNTPPSLIKMLKTYEKLAKPKIAKKSNK